MKRKDYIRLLKISSALVGLILFWGNTVLAQGYYWEEPPRKHWFRSYTVEGNIGMSHYFGDIQNLNKLNGPGLGYGGSFAGNISKRFSVAAQYLRGGLRGTRDFHSTAQGPETLRGRATNYQGLVYFHFVPFYQFRRRTFKSVSYWSKFNGYVFLGGGYMRYKSTVSPGAEATGSGRSITKGTFGIPYGIGARYRFDAKWSIGLDYSFSFLFGDDLDATPRAGTKRDTYSVLTAKLGYTFRSLRLRF